MSPVLPRKTLLYRLLKRLGFHDGGVVDVPWIKGQHESRLYRPHVKPVVYTYTFPNRPLIPETTLVFDDSSLSKGKPMHFIVNMQFTHLRALERNVLTALWEIFRIKSEYVDALLKSDLGIKMLRIRCTPGQLAKMVDYRRTHDMPEWFVNLTARVAENTGADRDFVVDCTNGTPHMKGGFANVSRGPFDYSVMSLYDAGAQVLYRGDTYKAKRTVCGGPSPDVSPDWEKVVPEWRPGVEFKKGDVVTYQGSKYAAKRVNVNRNPRGYTGYWSKVEEIVVSLDLEVKPGWLLYGIDFGKTPGYFENWMAPRQCGKTAAMLESLAHTYGGTVTGRWTAEDKAKFIERNNLGPVIAAEARDKALDEVVAAFQKRAAEIELKGLKYPPAYRQFYQRKVQWLQREMLFISAMKGGKPFEQARDSVIANEAQEAARKGKIRVRISALFPELSTPATAVKVAYIVKLESGVELLKIDCENTYLALNDSRIDWADWSPIRSYQRPAPR